LSLLSKKWFKKGDNNRFGLQFNIIFPILI